jgi:hypothetical protein
MSTAHHGREMLIGVRQDHTFDLPATRRERVLNHRRDWYQRGVLLCQPPPVEVSKSRPSEHPRASVDKCSKRLWDGIQIGASPTVEEVPLEVHDGVGLERALQLLVDHDLIRGDCAPQRL